MALPLTLLAGLLMLSSVQASDIADNSMFMAHHLNLRTSKDFEPQKVEGMEEDKDVQKLLTNESNMPVGLSAIGIALLSFAVMVGVRMRRGVQPAIVLASSDRNGIDMSTPLATVSGNNTWELMSQSPPVRSPEHMLQGSDRALAKDMHAHINSPFALWDPLGLGEDAPEAHAKNFRRSELQHGLVAWSAMTSVFFVSPQKPSPRSAATLHAADDDAQALQEQAAALRAEADALAAEASAASAEPQHVAAKELTPEEKTQREIENRKKITRALVDATKARNQEQIQIALATAEKAGGFSKNDPEIMAAMKAYNELNELSDSVRNKLVKEMRKSQPGDEEFQNAGNLYLGIFGLMTVLVIAGGKGIFY